MTPKGNSKNCDLSWILRLRWRTGSAHVALQMAVVETIGMTVSTMTPLF
jgi:hypothetical protein